MDIPEEERFRANILDLGALVHELTTNCWNAGRREVAPQLVAMGEDYLKKYESKKIIEGFINHSYEYWEKIRLREEDFFINHAHVIFQQLPIKSENINAFKMFFTAKDNKGKDIVIEDDRKAIWVIFESLVKISIKYVHKSRGIKTVQTEQGPRQAYIDKNKFKFIDVKALSTLWKIELPTA